MKALRQEKVYQRNDQRILGDGDFVGRVLGSAEEAMEKRYALRSLGFDLGRVAFRVSEVLGVKTEEVWAKGNNRRIVESRSLLCYWAVRELGNVAGSDQGRYLQSMKKFFRMARF